MSVIIFIVILLVLVVAHEFGHLIAAKSVGMKALEFGVGFPPKLWGKKIGETEYSINALPFGGFVKIFGEDPKEGEADARAFSNRPRIAQGVVLFAGPFANFLLAFILSSAAFMVGLPSAVTPENRAAATNLKVIVVEVLPDSPAEKAGFHPGDQVVRIENSIGTNEIQSPEDIANAVAQSSGPATVSVLRRGELVLFSVMPESGVVPDEPSRHAIGVSSALIGTVSLSVPDALVAGFTDTVNDTRAVVGGLFALIGSAFTLSADLSDVAGPVGIASLVGDAASFGVGSVLAFAALISLNLGVINLFPFPALDGGRLAFLIAEAVTRRPIPVSVANALNTLGFALLILLMIAITAQDISRLIG